jgi:trigger factor
VKSTVENLSPTRVKLAIEVPFAELEPSLKKAYRDIAAQVTIPGFRKGKVPAAIIDQRVGREAVLSEAVQEAIPEQLLAAVRAHEVKTLGRPDVEITDFGDGQPLRFTAEVDVRPQITLPDLADIEVVVDEIQVSDDEVETQLDGLRQRFASLKSVDRPAQRGDFVQIDLAATVDGEEVPGGSATNLSHEVGSNQLLPGLDDTIEGMSAGTEETFTTQLVGGDYAGREADVVVTVRSVRERELPALDDDFAQLASEFDTLPELRADLVERLQRIKRIEQIYSARDKALEALVAAADVPAPEGIVRDEVETRQQAMADQLERIGTSIEDYLDSEGKTEDDLKSELTAAATQGVRIQLLLESFADAQKIEVTDDEYGHEVVHRARSAGVSPQQYYDQLVRAGAAASVYSDVRRSKALGWILEQVRIKDSAGATISVDEIRQYDAELAPGPDHDDHEGHDHD